MLKKNNVKEKGTEKEIFGSRQVLPEGIKKRLLKQKGNSKKTIEQKTKIIKIFQGRVIQTKFWNIKNSIHKFKKYLPNVKKSHNVKKEGAIKIFL